MRTRHTVLRLLAVINFVLAGIVGVAGVAAAQTSAAGRPAAVASQNAAESTSEAACTASIRKQLPARFSSTDVATAAKKLCAPFEVTETTTVASTNVLGSAGVRPDTGGGYCPCLNFDFTNHWQVRSATWSATLQAEWTGDDQANFISRSWPEDYQRCVQDYAYGYTISMGGCTSGGPDPANHGQTMTMHMDFVVSFMFKGFPLSAGHGVDVTLLVDGHGGYTYSGW